MNRFGALIMFVALSSLAALGCGDSNETGSGSCSGTESCLDAPCGSGTGMYKICTNASAGCAQIVYKTPAGDAKASCVCSGACDTAAYTTCNTGGPAKACM